MEKPLDTTPPFGCTEEFTVERDPMNANSVIKPSYGTVTFDYMKEHTPERNLMSASSVEKPSAVTAPSRDTNLLILWKIPMNVSSI